MYNQILLPTDGSENSKRADKHALWIADKSNADIVIIYVIEPHFPVIATGLPISTLPTPDERFYEEIRNEGKQIIANFRKELDDLQCKGICKNTNLKSILIEGKPSTEIVNVLDKEDIDLVVMGASGRHGLDRFVIGSVTERVVRNARKPVMVIP
ncbi:MAG: universal stress protein [Methanobacterium sp.]|uniref:universal stress protein n=1 Tax=Methanobacterium sp. TaxID=2164 RepID=UPI003C782716